MVFEQQIRPVDPFQLAIRTGISRGGDVDYRPYAQLTGGLGEFNIDLEGAANQAAQSAIDWGVSQIPSATGASSQLDVVPYQNAVLSNVITPIASQVNGPNAASLSAQSLDAMWNALIGCEQQWLNFLHNTPWPSSKQRQRAQAAERTLQPYFDLYKQRLTALMGSAGTSVSQWVTGVPTTGVLPVTFPDGSTAGGGPYSVTTAGFSELLPVGLGVLAIWFFSKRRG